MQRKIYHLSTCDTCRKICKIIDAEKLGFEMRDIKEKPLTAKEIDTLAKRTGSYESLINKRATLWKERKLGEKQLSEADFRQLLLEHYTFLKRPVIDFDGQLFVGNEKSTVATAKNACNPSGN